MMCVVAAALVLRSGDESRLSSLVRSSTVEAGFDERARIVLLAAGGRAERGNRSAGGDSEERSDGDSVAQPVEAGRDIGAGGCWTAQARPAGDRRCGGGRRRHVQAPPEALGVRTGRLGCWASI